MGYNFATFIHFDGYAWHNSYDEKNEIKIISTICVLMDWQMCKKRQTNWGFFLKLMCSIQMENYILG